MLETEFYGNTVGKWALAFAIIIGAAVVGKAFYWTLKNLVKKFTENTKTRLDDIILDMIEEPLVFALVVAGIWYAVSTLTLTDSVHIWVNKGFYILVIYNVAWLTTRTFDALVNEYIAPLIAESEGDLDDQLLPIVRRGIKAAVWILAVIVGLNNAGYDVGALLAGLGIGGLAFALAAQDTVSNLFGGFTIFTDRPFTINDRIKAAGFDGTVIEIGMRSTRIKTLEGRIVTIPNSKIASAPVENVSSEPGRKVVMALGLTYDMNESHVQKAMDLLHEISEANEAVEADPVIGFSDFGDFALTVTFIYWVKKDEPIMGTKTAMNMEILKQFNANKLEFAFPSQTIYHKSV